MTPDGWTRRKVASFASRIRRGNEAGLDLEPLSITKDRGVVLQSEKYNKRIATNPKKYVIAEDGDFAFDPMSLYYGSIGRVHGIGRGLVSPDYVVFGIDESVDSDFLLKLLRFPEMHKTYESLSETGNSFGKRRRLYWSVFDQIELDLPPLPEQRKIAAILSSMDDAIESTQAVIDQLGVVKKAMMAELLTRGLPGRHTKFKQTEIGEVPEGWEVVRMDALAVPKGMVGGPFGSDLTAKDYVRESGVPVIRGGNVSMGQFHDREFVYVSEDKARTLAKNSARCGDLVMTQRGVSLGETTLIPSGASHDWYVISQTMMRMSPDTSKVSARFLLHYLCSSGAQGWLQNHQIATGQPHLNLGIFRELPALVPPRDEQEGIAEAAERLEAVANGNVAEVLALQRVKSALMSVLLTGEVRVRLDEDAA